MYISVPAEEMDRRGDWGGGGSVRERPGEEGRGRGRDGQETEEETLQTEGPLHFYTALNISYCNKMSGS